MKRNYKRENASRQIRYVATQVRAADDDGRKVIEGHAAVFNQRSPNHYGFTEEVAPGAFTKTLREADVVALFNHDPNFPLGRKSAGTLELHEDEEGLFFRAFPQDADPNGHHESVRRGDVTGASFSFDIVKQDIDTSGDVSHHTIREAKLFDVGPVTFPFYPGAESEARGLEMAAAEMGVNFERLARALKTGEDPEIIQATIEALRNIEAGEGDNESKTEPDPSEDHSASDLAHSPGRLLRRLNLKERTRTND